VHTATPRGYKRYPQPGSMSTCKARSFLSTSWGPNVLLQVEGLTAYLQAGVDEYLQYIAKGPSWGHYKNTSSSPCTFTARESMSTKSQRLLEYGNSARGLMGTYTARRAPCVPTAFESCTYS
jgi:hypothetical protein